MNRVVGILDEQTEYAKRLAQYVNERKEIGCFMASFRDEEDLALFCERKTLSVLLLGGNYITRKEELREKLSEKVGLWFVTETPEEAEELSLLGERAVFRYQRADALMRQLLDFTEEERTGMPELEVFFSAESSLLAEKYARARAAELAQDGRTLLLAWDAFSGFQRTEEAEPETPSISELLYFMRKDAGQVKRLFTGIRRKEGVESFSGVDFCTDLWQFSAEEMKKMLLQCRELGNYRHIVFWCGFVQDGMLAVMNLADRITLVYSAGEGQKRKEEFYRQMKYAGEQSILSRLNCVEGGEVKSRG